MLILTAISKNNKEELRLIEDMVVKENDYWGPAESRVKNTTHTVTEAANTDDVTDQMASALVYALLP